MPPEWVKGGYYVFLSINKYNPTSFIQINIRKGH